MTTQTINAMSRIDSARKGERLPAIVVDKNRIDDMMRVIVAGDEIIDMEE